MKAKRKKSNIFKVMEKKNQPRILYSANIFFKNKAKTKTFSDKTKGKKKNLCQQASTARNTTGIGEQLHHMTPQ